MVFGRPFIDETGLVYNEEEGTVTFKQDDEKIMYFSFGRHLDDLHVTWAHLEKKRTRNEPTPRHLKIGAPPDPGDESQAIHDAVNNLLQVTWAHLEKKQTRLRTNTKTLEDLCS
ncbi:hypothetical protein Tco_0695848 [Tanacetum coccineum]